MIPQLSKSQSHFNTLHNILIIPLDDQHSSQFLILSLVLKESSHEFEAHLIFDPHVCGHILRAWNHISELHQTKGCTSTANPSLSKINKNPDSPNITLLFFLIFFQNLLLEVSVFNISNGIS